MATVKQQLIRRIFVAGVVLFLVVLPAAIMAYLAYNSLREIRIREDFFFEQVGHDLSKRLISTLEMPLYGPGFELAERFVKGQNFGDPAEIRAVLGFLEKSSEMSDAFFWYPGSMYPAAVRSLYYDPESFTEKPVSELIKPIEERTLQVFREGEAFRDLPRGFTPKTYQGYTVAIWGMRFADETWVMTLVAEESGNTIGFLTYRLNEKEYLRLARGLYNEMFPSGKIMGGMDEVPRDLGAEVYFNLLPFNDEAHEATSDIAASRNYVYDSKGYESSLWGIRVFVANRERVRVNDRLVTSMLALLAGLFALIVLGVLLLYYLVSKELQLAKLKSGFVSNVSHELKTPLSLIRLFAETLEMDRVESEQEKKRFYSIIHNESVRLTNLINNILDFSRIEEGRKKYEMATEDLKSLLSDTLDAYAFQLDTAGFKVNVQSGDGEYFAEVDRDSFKQAVLNLLDNAVKYSGDERRIDVGLSRSGGFVRVSVRDYGIGILPQDLTRVFDKFFRAGNEDVYKVKGSGLGLAVVRHIMDAHSGRIDVRSEPGKGSEFCLLFPESAGSREPGEGGAGPLRQPSGGRKS
ncbi:MAG: HAMP domain-containing histidine kinase [bacterium]